MPAMDDDAALLWQQTKPDANGLVTAVVQHVDTGVVLMVGAMNREALALTLSRGRVTFFSRSRQTLWEKGETSGNALLLHDLRVDCDGDAVLVRARPLGPTCHTGASSCFFRAWRPPQLERDDGPAPGGPRERVFEVVLARKAGLGMTQAQGKSYVRDLLAGGATRIAAKIREEADELARALEGESDDRVVAEAADLEFHAMVALALRDLGPDAVAAVLASRMGVSGIDEKSSRPGR